MGGSESKFVPSDPRPPAVRQRQKAMRVTDLTEEQVQRLVAIITELKVRSDDLQALHDDRKAYHDNLDYTNYSRDPESDDWERLAPELHKAYKRYKALCDQSSVAKGAFDAAGGNIPSTYNHLPDEKLLRLANLAIGWMEASLVAGEARMFVLINWPRAYSDQRSNKTHLEEVESRIQAAGNALEYARQMRDAVYYYGRLNKYGVPV